jgi:hypothetical protein
MEEQIISFDTAVLVKKAGFNELTSTCYRFNDSEDCYILVGENSPHYFNNQENEAGYVADIAAPTQSLLQRWLREVHNIHIEIVYIDQILKFQAEICLMNSNTIVADTKCGTYEQVLEEALKQALMLIKEKDLKPIK